MVFAKQICLYYIYSSIQKKETATTLRYNLLSNSIIQWQQWKAKIMMPWPRQVHSKLQKKKFFPLQKMNLLNELANSMNLQAYMDGQGIFFPEEKCFHSFG